MIEVSTQTQLEEAISGPREIVMAPGVYRLTLDGISQVIFRAADPTNPPVISSLRLKNCVGVSFEDIAFHMQEKDVEVFHSPWNVSECSELSFLSCSIRGVMEPAGRGHGLVIRNSENIVIVGTDFFELRKGLILVECVDITLEDLSFQHMSEDAMMLAVCQDALVDTIRIAEFWGEPGLSPHPDAISLGKDGCSDIKIFGVMVMDKIGPPPPGLVQLRAQGVHCHQADNVMIKDSAFGVSSLNAILIEEGEGVIVENIFTMALSKDATPRVTIPKV